MIALPLENAVINKFLSVFQALASSLNPHFLEFLQALGWPQGIILGLHLCNWKDSVPNKILS